MKAADQVTAIADHLARLDETRQARLREHFAVCDLDENGWLSLREAEVTLAFQRAEFRRADADQDGRIDVAEFAAQQDVVLARLGVQAPPSLALPAADAGAEPLAEPPLDAPPETAAASAAPDAAPPPSGSELSGLEPRPADLVTRYDGNASAALDAAEVERFLADSGLTLVPDLVVDLYDRDDSGALEAAELYPLAWMASKRLPAAPDEAPDAAEPAPAGPSASTLQRLTHFGRLDPDGDGFVTEAELRKLQSPARLELRLRALLSGMDQDGDGRLSEAEYRASMGDARR